MKKLLIFLVWLLAGFSAAAAQSAGKGVEMADALRQDGKIYVVVAVVVIIFTGLLIYLFVTDRKLGRLEKEIRDNKRL